MNIINLSDPESSLVPIKVTQYPDGQQDLRILAMPSRLEEESMICARMNSFRDIELIILAKRALENMGWTKPVSLYCPYLLGGRSDRLFASGGVRYIKDVVAPIINSLGFSRVTVMDPHSDVMENTIDRLEKIHFHTVFAGELRKFDGKLTLVSPDGGSLKKIYDVASFIGIDRILVCGKHRDVATGKILATTAPPCDEEDNLVVCDDICDGGRTFVELAKAIRNQTIAPKLHLFVTHGIFSKGVSELASLYSSIVTTNSVRKFNDEEMKSADLSGCRLIQIRAF